MDREWLVSVVIPAFNSQAYLQQAIESVLAQEYHRIQIIVVDDGSTDASATIARQYGPPVECEIQSHQGISAARNRGVALARGELLAFLDADDLWEKGKLEAQISELERDPGLDVVFGHVQQFISPELDEQTAQRIYCPPNPMPGYTATAMLIRRASFLKVGQFDTQYKSAEVVDWLRRAQERGLKMLMLPGLVARRRLHRSNQGVRRRDLRMEYVRIIKASLDRRRK